MNVRVLARGANATKDIIMSRESTASERSGNVFADPGLADAGARLAKAELARGITVIIRGRGLTQREAAHVLEIDQPNVSALTRGRPGDVSLERLPRHGHRHRRVAEPGAVASAADGRPWRGGGTGCVRRSASLHACQVRLAKSDRSDPYPLCWLLASCANARDTR